VVTAATIVLYYQPYVGGYVGGEILSDPGISFPFFIVNITSNAFGALASGGRTGGSLVTRGGGTPAQRVACALRHSEC